MSEPIDPGVVELAGRVFGLARGGSPEEAAVFRQSGEAVLRLLDAGADPNLGGRSARATAQFFDLPAMTALLDGARR